MTISFHPVQHLRRYQQIGTTFARHGFGFAFQQLQPAMRRRLGLTEREPAKVPADELAKHFRLALEELGPTFVKLGQVLSTRPDVLPPTYIDELSLLHDEVAPESWEDIRRVLETEYKRPLDEFFAHIDRQPLAAASLAQVHAATLCDGSEVVIKVQRPDIRRIINVDLSILAEIAAAGQYTPIARHYDLPAIAEQFSATMRAELDYRREGRNADRVRANFAQETYVYVPHIHWKYTTQRVLVMERIYGIKINDLPALEAAGYDRHRIALNSAKIVIKEVLEDGFFHADPHPGNFLIMPDEVIGGLDFGMVGYIDEHLRLDLIRLYAASVESDPEGVVDELIRMGAADEDVNRRGLTRDISQLLNKYRGLPLQDIRAGEVITDLMPIAFRHRLRLPTDLWLLGKTMQMLEGIGLQLDPDFDIFEVSQPIVRRMFWKMVMPNPTTVRQTAIRTAADWSDVISMLPRATSRVLHQAERGELFTVHLKEADHILTVADRLVTRLSLSMLLTGAMLGLAFLIPATTGNLLARIIVVLGFLAATAISAWLVFSILRSYRRPRR